MRLVPKPRTNIEVNSSHHIRETWLRAIVGAPILPEAGTVWQKKSRPGVLKKVKVT
jgi:hypothetical protein